MNLFFTRPNQENALNWPGIVFCTLGFWLSGSLLIDVLILPSLSATGMMAQDGFASAGYVLFGLFNHLELLCAALVITGCLVLHRSHYFAQGNEQASVFAATLLLGIALIYTYILTPNMSGLGIELSWLEPNQATLMSGSMLQMQVSYWALEVVKLALGFTLVRWFARHIFSSH
ncbi:hypothetical protein PN462_18915 [Spirulina sp. CS-785/01]|uniref:hypothetical protein n=1 Tax=Spirulina sp. CS-785/01 TaxID=3021716 RepID=UPI00232F538E|nr:hypothetical protein [Spirulina sp. CS-785/01]MDB9315193.1 hypothetical protein [Spirulina sp. CS-785/01]